MRGRKTIYPITLTDEQKKHLQQLVNARNTPQGKARRAKVILLAAEHPDWKNDQIAAQAGCSEKTVCTWRARCAKNKSWRIDRGRDGLGFFPLRCGRRPRRWRVAGPRWRECPWLAGAIPGLPSAW
jgi:hypothetical protein